MTVGVEDAPSVQRAPLRPVTIGWFVRRTLLGVAILMVAMGGLAWLTYASIDPTLDDTLGKETAKPAPAAPRIVPVEL